jgi:hypothetical protein
MSNQDSSQFPPKPGQPRIIPCCLPPVGWACTREAGHPGPCAAVPAAVPISAVFDRPYNDFLRKVAVINQLVAGHLLMILVAAANFAAYAWEPDGRLLAFGLVSLSLSYGAAYVHSIDGLSTRWQKLCYLVAIVALLDALGSVVLWLAR